MRRVQEKPPNNRPSPLMRRSKSFTWKTTKEETRDGWVKGWQGHPMWVGGTRFSTDNRREAFQTTIDRAYNTHTGNFKERPPYAENKTGPARTRDTWIMKHMRNTHWTPGPGTYRSEREFLVEVKDECDTNLTVQERAPDYSFGRETKETRHELKNMKFQRNHGRYYKTTDHYTPGPGSYMQYTQFAASSGGDRKTWLNRKHEFPWPATD